jgi:hypothetical protein
MEEEVEGMGDEDLEEHRVVEECIARWRTPSSLFARTACVPGLGPRTKV